MNEFFQVLDQHFKVFLMLAIGGMFVVGHVVRAFAQMHRTALRERSRREIAAYVAEGTITPDQGERLLRAEVSAAREHAC